LGADWKRQGGFQPPPGWQGGGYTQAGPDEAYEFRFGGTGFSDFFEQFFGARGGFGTATEEEPELERERPGFGRGRGFARKGSDIQGDIMVNLEEVLHGAVRPVSFQTTNRRTGEAETHTFRVKIPQGVQDGQLIRVAGKGEAGIGGGSPGDLYLRVRLAKHPDFRVRGADLQYDLALAPWEAVLGTTVRVPTLDAPISLRIPAGTAAGQQLRAKGRGLPNRSGERGDLYAVVNIDVPSKVTPEERTLWEQLASKSNFRPRES
jgi:curved DNA-binding protein